MRSLGLRPELLPSGLNLGKLGPLNQLNNVSINAPPHNSHNAPRKCFESLSLQNSPRLERDLWVP